MNKTSTALRRGVRQVKKLWHSGQSRQALAAVQKLVQQWPGHAPLWILLGDLIQLQEEATVPLEDAKSAYLQATLEDLLAFLCEGVGR